jgi:hypothetical protein
MQLTATGDFGSARPGYAPAAERSDAEWRTMSTTGPGWYPDPGDPAQHRWWDGSQWTAATQPVTPTPPTSTPAASNPYTPYRAPTLGAPAPAAPTGFAPTSAVAPQAPKGNGDYINPKVVATAIAVGLVVVALIGFLVLRGSGGGSSPVAATTPTSAATSTSVARHSTKATASASPTTTRPRSTTSAAPTTAPPVTAPPTTAGTASLAQLGAAYLAAANTVNAAKNVFAQSLYALPAGSTTATVAAIADRYASALGVFDSTVSALPVPSSLVAARNAVVAANQKLKTDLETAASLQPSAFDGWTNLILSDLDSVTAAAGAFRADLGLPQY